jgi:hypothetical protein
MALTLTVGVNSWVTLAEANEYFEGRYRASSAWASLSDATKKQLLISAYNWIQQQASFSISASETSEIVKQAQYETAWYLYEFGEEDEKRRALSGQGVTEFELNNWREKLSEYEFPKFIEDMLDDFYDGKGVNIVEFEREY